MPTREDVYRKFGMASEAAQLIETDLGTLLLTLGVFHEGLITPELKVDRVRANDLVERINRQTLGQLIRSTTRLTDELQSIEGLLADALEERNRLAHSFYRQHNLRIQSDGGRAIMLQDLEEMHQKFLAAWKALNLVRGIDLDAIVKQMDEAASKRTDSGEGDDDDPIAHLPI